MTEKKKNFFGLTDEQVAASREKHGENILRAAKKKSFMRCFFENLGDPVIKILLAALVVNVIFTVRGGDWYETVGIGLSVCSSIIKAHNGFFEAENAPDGGAVFRFSLPITDQSMEENQA